MNTRIPAALTALTACALLAGCSTGQATAPAEPVAENAPMADKSKWPKPEPERGLAKGLNLPLETHLQTYEDTVTLDKGMRHLQEKCMADYGLTVTLPLEGTNPPPNDNDANMERRYGLTDRENAARHGYGLPGESDSPVKQKAPELSDAEVEVLTGREKNPASATGGPPGQGKPARESYNGKKIHEDGCTGWAAKQINQPTTDELTFIAELNGQSFTGSMQAPAVQEALATWSSCMKKVGYEAFPTPFEAANSIQHIEGAPTAEEKNLAVAEVDCKEKSGLVGVWFEEESKIQKQLIADNQAKLDALRTRNAEAVAAASKATGA
jgi:hypothetical protein